MNVAKKKRVSRAYSPLVLITLLFVLLFSFSQAALAADGFEFGTGTEEDPYMITSAADLVNMRTLINTSTTPAAIRAAHYKLANDIDMTGTNWTAGIGAGRRA